MSHLRASKSQQGAACQAGFTLIELLVAMTISAVVVVMAYQALNQVIVVQETSQAHTERWQAIEKAVLLLNQDMRQLTPRPIKDALGGDLPALMYRPDLGLGLTRLHTAPGLVASGGLLRVDYAFEDGQLQRRLWPVLDRAPDTEPVNQTILDAVAGLQWRFLDGAGQWHATWPPANAPLTALPYKIEMILTLKDQGQDQGQDQGRVRRLWQTPGNHPSRSAGGASL